MSGFNMNFCLRSEGFFILVCFGGQEEFCYVFVGVSNKNCMTSF